MSPDDKRFAVVRDPNTLEVWNLETSAKAFNTTLTNPYVGGLSALRFNPTSSQLAFYEQNACDLHVLNANDGTIIRNITLDQPESKTIEVNVQVKIKNDTVYTITGTAMVQGEPAYTVTGEGYLSFNQVLVQAVPYTPPSAQIALLDPSGNIAWGMKPNGSGVYYGSNALFFNDYYGVPDGQDKYAGTWVKNAKQYTVTLKRKP